MTFREFQYLNKLWADDKLNLSQIAYESMRLQTYFQFSLQVSKRYKRTFERFCKEYMPFAWDPVDPEQKKDQAKLAAMTADDWAERDRMLAERSKGTTRKATTKEL